MKTKTARSAKPEDLIEAIHSSQKSAVEMARELTERIGNVAPELWTGTPVEGIPSAKAIADMAFDLARKVLEAQHEFVRQLIDAVAGAGHSEDAGSRRKS